MSKTIPRHITSDMLIKPGENLKGVTWIDGVG
jgi:hypothetical protein